MISKQEQLLYENENYKLTTHRVKQGGDEATLIHEELLHITRPSHEVVGVTEENFTTINPVPQGLPNYRGSIPVLGAMYKLAVQEMQSVLNERGEFTAGASWDGVWTRDTAYAILLGAPLVMPDACRRSLESRVKDGIILQDTGTGGGWPISTDRVVWILAAWTYFNATQDKDWVESQLDVMKNTLAQDDLILRKEKGQNGQQGLFPGESSFLDWREQNYPDWMNPADIGASFAFGTNLLHAAARRALASMLRSLGRKEEAKSYKEDAKELISIIQQQFWDTATRQFGMLRCHDGVLDSRPDALATALGVLFGLAGEHGQEALNKLPRSPFGTPVFAPCKSSQPDSYHNRSIWPFVEAFVLLAHAELQDAAGMEQSMASLLRAAMLFASNKENLHAFTGEADDTIQSSDAQCWSSSGMLGMFYHGLFGIRFDGDNLVFTPCVPRAYAGSHWIMGLRIGKLTLDIHINGYGSEICSALINGKMSAPIIPLSGEGRLIVELELQPSYSEEEESAAQYPAFQEDLPEPTWDDPSPEQLCWLPVEEATAYRIFCNGRAVAQTASCTHPISATGNHAVYRIQALNAHTYSYPNAPYHVIAEGCHHIIPVQRIGEHGEHQVERGQAWLDEHIHTKQLFFAPTQLSAGQYKLRVVYSNAAQSLRDGDGCAIRALYCGEEHRGFIALPQQGEQGEWENFYLTASYPLSIEEDGSYELSLRYTEDCHKGDASSQCFVRELELIKENA